MSRNVSALEFGGRVAIVTGGAGGLGRQISTEFVRRGAVVICADTDAHAGESLMSEVKDLPGTLIFARADLGSAQGCAQVAQAAIEAGGIDILCNNVGIQPPSSYVPAHLLDDAVWDSILTVNVKSYFWMVKHCIPTMKRQGHGVIVNIASVQGMQSQKGAAAYAASKGAVLTLTKQLALEYAEDNIRVVAVAPGTFDTPLLRDVAKGIPDPGYMSRLKNAYPMKRFGDPAELAQVVAFLAGSGASFMTGTCIVVDGGIMAQGGWAQ